MQGEVKNARPATAKVDRGTHDQKMTIIATPWSSGEFDHLEMNLCHACKGWGRRVWLSHTLGHVSSQAASPLSRLPSPPICSTHSTPSPTNRPHKSTPKESWRTLGGAAKRSHLRKLIPSRTFDTTLLESLTTDRMQSSRRSGVLLPTHQGC